MPVISVLIPCYNVANTVDEALSSLACQSLVDFEVILVDDGSTDGTLNCLQDWSRRDPRMRVLAYPHRGIIPSLNAGMAACQTELIARMDADDRSLPDRLKLQVEMLSSHPELALVSSLVKGIPGGRLGLEFRDYIDWLNTLHTDRDIKFAMFLQSPLAHPSVAYRRDWVERVGGYQDHSWAEDYDLWIRLFLAEANFGKVPQTLLEWRDHPQRLTHTDDRYAIQSDLRLKAYYLAHGPLSGGDEVIIWGDSKDAHHIGSELIKHGCPLSSYISPYSTQQAESDQNIGTVSEEKFLSNFQHQKSTKVLIVEPRVKRRNRIMRQVEGLQLHQNVDWWLVG